MEEQVVRTGTRYWPRQKGPAFLAAGTGPWEREIFDPGEIRDELSHVADTGFDFVRVALPWDWLQPDAGRLRTAILDHLAALLDAAVDTGLVVQLVIAGRLGGTLFLPRWLLALDATRSRLPVKHRLLSEGWEAPPAAGNLYEEERFLAGQRYLWREITVNFSDHPALAELDPGGGLISAVPPPNDEAPVEWWQQIAGATAEQPLPLLYTDSPSLLTVPAVPRLDQLQRLTGKLGLAATPISGGVALHGIDTAWPVFLLLLARTLARAPVGCAALAVPSSRETLPVTTLKGGGPANQIVLFAEEEQARFFSETLPALHGIGVPFIYHGVWADAPPALFGTPPYDSNEALRYAGLVRADGSEKEAADGWRQFNARGRRQEAGRSARVLQLDEEAWYDRRSDARYLPELYRRFLDGDL